MWYSDRTAHGLIVNEREELERIIETRLEGVDPVAAYIKEVRRDLSAD